MSNISMNVHRVKNMRVAHYFPSNAQNINLQFVQEDGGTFEVSIFNLPEDRAVEIVRLLSDPSTSVWGQGDNMTVTEYLATKGVFDAIEGKSS